MLNSLTHFDCPNCNALVLNGSSFCKVCFQQFKQKEPKPCALCLKFKILKKSHAIPNVYFREIKNKKGKLIAVSSDKVEYKQDSWYEHQLCGNCERLLNEFYEKDSLSFFREKIGKKIKDSKSITFRDIDTKKIQLFLLSIFWRAANSEHLAYKKIGIEEPWNNELRQYILENKPVPLNLVTVKLSYLTHDGKRNDENKKALIGTIITPFHRKLLYNRVSFCFLIKGFFIEFFIPSFGFKRKGVINLKKDSLVIPFIDIDDIPEFKELIVAGIASKNYKL